MKIDINKPLTYLLCSLTACLMPVFAFAQDDAASVAGNPDVTMTWVEKYLTYEQDKDGQLRLTDVHFLAEIIFDSDRDFDGVSANLYRGSDLSFLPDYGGKDKRAFTRV